MSPPDNITFPHLLTHTHFYESSSFDPRTHTTYIHKSIPTPSHSCTGIDPLRHNKHHGYNNQPTRHQSQSILPTPRPHYLCPRNDTKIIPLSRYKPLPTPNLYLRTSSVSDTRCLSIKAQPYPSTRTTPSL